MNAALIRARLTGCADRLADIRVKSPFLFGSAATGKAGADSDLDFLVEFEGTATFNRYMDLKELLERELQSRIDLVTMRALKPLLRDQILAAAVKIA